MIFDRFENAVQYAQLAPTIWRGLEFLSTSELLALPLGRVEIAGDDLFALVQDYETRQRADCRWESHKTYCDIQCVARGAERFGVSQLDRVHIVEPYDRKRDVAFYDGDGDYVTLRPGMFLILWPQDVHMPCVSMDTPQAVRKVVIKARVE